ncbi:hypothetical protein HB776_12460 [Tardiphaga robiniae]|uniref:Relaxase/mobilization nuclease domain-containing protein n=2 Tax=Tardiphaga robiniae TaxID=943830 RepID=A0A7G6TYW9_9BRAD|nr:hypothetical protein [Tardiphaga robiniae]QND71951.1 hypothetical protein HB776_12460 [Tardiphaga robiniae]
MEIYRDASASRAGAALHHVTINPAKNISREQLVQAVHKIRLELDPDGTRPFAIVIHRKKRSEAGGADEHAHLVLGAVDAIGKSLDDGWTKIRTERVARELEYELGEPALCGRHHRAVLKALYGKRPDVYLWLLNALGPDPEKPQSAISPAARNRARGQNLNLPKAKASVRAIWQKSENVDSFRNGLSQIGLRIVAGERSNVFVIVDEKGRLIGAANRILQTRREKFNTMMESSNEPATRSAALTNVGRSRPTSVRPDQLSSPEDRRIRAAVDTVKFGAGGRGGRRPNSADHRLAEPASRQWGSPRGSTTGDKTTDRLRQHRALTQLRQLDFLLLQALTSRAQSIPTIPFVEAGVGPQEDGLVHKDLWGIVLLPKPRW